jgi:hypothetical protein
MDVKSSFCLGYGHRLGKERGTKFSKLSSAAGWRYAPFRPAAAVDVRKQAAAGQTGF